MFSPRHDDHLEHFNDTPVQIVGLDQFNAVVAKSNSKETFGHTHFYYDLRDNIIARMDQLQNGFRYVIYPARA